MDFLEIKKMDGCRRKEEREERTERQTTNRDLSLLFLA